MINIGLLGLGTVGIGVVEILQNRKREVYELLEEEINIKKILVKNIDKKRDVDLNKDILTLERDISFVEALKRSHEGIKVETLYSKNGFEYSLVISPICEHDRAIGFCLLFLDITEKAHAEELRREFSANVSHELKTPLQTILASSELLSAGVVKSEDVKDFITKIHSEASRLVSLIDDCISISELDEGSTMQFDKINAPSLIDDVVNALQGSADNKKISIKGGYIIINIHNPNILSILLDNEL